MVARDQKTKVTNGLYSIDILKTRMCTGGLNDVNVNGRYSKDNDRFPTVVACASPWPQKRAKAETPPETISETTPSCSSQQPLLIQFADELSFLYFVLFLLPVSLAFSSIER